MFLRTDFLANEGTDQKKTENDKDKARPTVKISILKQV